MPLWVSHLWHAKMTKPLLMFYDEQCTHQLNKPLHAVFSSRAHQMHQPIYKRKKMNKMNVNKSMV